MPARAWVARSCLILGVTALAVSLAAGIARVALNLFFQLYVRGLLGTPQQYLPHSVLFALLDAFPPLTLVAITSLPIGVFGLLARWLARSSLLGQR